MRLRTVLVILAALLVVVFALLNWQEVTRPTSLNLGFAQVQAPMGLILLSLLGLATLVFMTLVASVHTRSLVESRQHAKALEAQRELADRAEASRLAELRQQIDTYLNEGRQRETRAAAELEQAFARIQRDLRQQVDQSHRALATRLGEMEGRVTQQLERMERGRAPMQPAEPIPITDVTAQRPVDQLP
ncbi:hypothetical protein JI739_00440 [Ramlibacter sp. AW1]|uniref:LapA family protein n=1 Tax=Ramlibacter aurantiacus TaxID=2801330 RepID=A0A936ZJB3_9BURK|nr:hypothetical protein [Ramlibacter aurantiacus]MBL0418801.1 hypothetical protein [Ramlibacter aurantiacus]